ncbi:MAG TPA: response regulator transcription factor [Saprospiraceae bacterium]|nr:response regulator transcription factor [Saprospiraceae bacterium]
MKILLVEDEIKLLRSLRKGLEEHGVEVDEATDGISAQQMCERHEYAVIVSDVLMPGQSGLDLLQYLRRRGDQTPVILLTALSQTDDKVLGFEAGADDYLAKPFEFRELLLRTRALARRNAPHASPQPVLRFADLEMNLDSKDVSRAGRRITLTPREFALMEYLLRNPGRVISKTEISEKVWNLNFDTGTNVVEVYVNFLRKKIDRDFERKIIHTQFRNGYILREED